MKIITHSFIGFISLFILPAVLFGQAKSTTNENYYSSLKDAESKTDRQIRKEIQIQKLYTNGNLTETITDTTEYLSPNIWRWVSIDEEGKNVKKIEEVAKGDFIYRKEDNNSWAKRGKDD